MKVQITSPEIPEGYTLRRCDGYTPEEFVHACSINYAAASWSLIRAERLNPHALAYVKEHPKEQYTTADLHAVLRMTKKKREV